MRDTLAVLAMILGLDGGDQVQERLAAGQTSAVNLSEVVAKLEGGGVPDEAFFTVLQN